MGVPVASRFVVLQVYTDNTVRAWGPFTKDRTALVRAALLAQPGTKGLQMLPLNSSTALDVELPGWKREPR